MFTGIIEEIGYIRSIIRGNQSAKIKINAHRVCQGTHVGDSIAVNGVCLTVTEIAPSYFTADIMAETLYRTNLEYVQNGDSVNLERALTPTSRIGGHFVSGHVDERGLIRSLVKKDIASIIEITCNPNLLKYIAVKGSIALDGISLTVCDVSHTSFFVSLIPHTMMYTSLKQKKVGDTINIECDLIARYIENLLTTQYETTLHDQDPALLENLLKLSGFIGGVK
ncbi:riboflavin synthase [Gracilinema caldarium]|uniref:Riboflavin synthase n=1 Tax=Gracilinema caldarium (strain ATCC 51460 / DSM 7334 / H1) TaxID=744872 RepID=F8EWU9_GRAC1|nr:riboflavin synthase [Gracilinema caldarium]AEJ18335.1 riboflavin synthase, alpha subunit [Gracilinema caldarium DSM 7334]